LPTLLVIPDILAK